MTLHEWLAAVSTELGLDDLDVGEDTVRLLLDLSRDAAHGVTKIAAPLTTFVVGVAVGRGATLAEAAAAVSRVLPASGEATPPAWAPD